MSKMDFSGFDDDDSEEGKHDRFEDELKKYKDMYGDGASNITSIEALEELVNYFFDHERYDEALRTGGLRCCTLYRLGLFKLKSY